MYVYIYMWTNIIHTYIYISLSLIHIHICIYLQYSKGKLCKFLPNCKHIWRFAEKLTIQAKIPDWALLPKSRQEMQSIDVPWKKSANRGRMPAHWSRIVQTPLQIHVSHLVSLWLAAKYLFVFSHARWLNRQASCVLLLSFEACKKHCQTRKECLKSWTVK